MTGVKKSNKLGSVDTVNITNKEMKHQEQRSIIFSIIFSICCQETRARRAVKEQHVKRIFSYRTRITLKVRNTDILH